MNKDLVKSGKILMGVGMLVMLTFASFDEGLVAVLIGMILTIVGAKRVQNGSRVPIVGKIIASMVIGGGSELIGFGMFSTILDKLDGDKVYNLLILLKNGNWRTLLPALIIIAVGLMIDSYLFYLISGEMYKATEISTFKTAEKLYKISIWSIPLLFGIFIAFAAEIAFIVAGFSELVVQEETA